MQGVKQHQNLIGKMFASDLRLQILSDEDKDNDYIVVLSMGIIYSFISINVYQFN